MSRKTATSRSTQPAIGRRAALYSDNQVRPLLMYALALVVLLLYSNPGQSQSSYSEIGAEPGPMAHSGSIVVYLHPDQQYADADSAARALMAGRDGDQQLARALFHPDSATPTFAPRPLPDGLPRDGQHPLQQMSHYLTLNYPTGVSLGQVIKALSIDPRIGFVDLVDGGWSGATVNDPFFTRPPTAPDPTFVGFQWGQHLMRFDDAWDWLPGHANIGMIDAGMLAVHEDLGDSLRAHLSWDYVQDDRDVTPNSGFRGHGSHVAGILAANTNNKNFLDQWEGVAGGCWHCSLLVAKAFQDDRAGAFAWLTESGAQVINFSGFFSGTGPQDLPEGVPCASFPLPQQHFMCPIVRLMELRDVVIVASSGNDLRRVDFPALEPEVIAVGGMEVTGQFWNLTNNGGCPNITLPGHGSSPQCGSNFGLEQELVAPALDVLSTFYPDATWSLPELNCLDDNFHGEHYPGQSGSGYAFCTGTSMSSAFVSAVAALLRSINPLLSSDDLRSAMIETASGGGNHSNVFGYGLPDVPDAANRIMGEVFGVPLKNRLTPMFTLYSGQADAWLYTSKPQVAVAGISGFLYETPLAFSGVPFNQAPIGAALPDYTSFPLEFGPAPAPSSSFQVFAGPQNPFSGSNDLVPLWRLSFAGECTSRDHVYATEQAAIDFFTQTDFCTGIPGTQGFRIDGIEGWIFASCPPGFSCDDEQDPAQPQCLHRRGSVSADAWALILERELIEPVYSGYTVTAGNSCVGLVFPSDDSDSDGLYDGFELAAGSNPQAIDSDCDGVEDGEELPLAGLPASDPMNGIPCADGAVAIQGNTSGQLGQLLNLTVTVSNPIGPSHAGLRVAIDVAALTDQGVESISVVGGSCDLHPNRVEGLYLCQLPSLARSFSVGVDITLRPTFVGNLPLSAELQFPDQADPYLGNNSAQRVLSISP